MTDKKKLIKYMNEELCADCSECIGHCSIRLLKEFIEKQPKVGEWIPVSDRLPEKSGKYLVTMVEGMSFHTSVRRFNPKPKHPEQNEPIFTKHVPYYSGWERATRGVIAWMPLPEPYKEEGAE